MRRLVLLASSLTLPVTHAYSYAFLREKADTLHPNSPIFEYSDTEPKSCRKINSRLETGVVNGMRLWTNALLGRAPWAFLFYTDSEGCDHHGNIPTLVVYCNKPVSNPFTFQLADFEPLAALTEGPGLWTLKSWEEIKPGTAKWRLFIEDLDLVPGQFAFDRVGRWGDSLTAVDPEIARVKMWATPTDRFDRPQKFLRDEELMREALGEDLGFDRYSRGLDEAPFLTKQKATEKWAGIFGIADLAAGDLVGPNPETVVRQPTTEKWAAIFGVGDVGFGLGGGMEEEGEEWSMGVPRQKLEDEMVSVDESLWGQYGSEYQVPVEIKIENKEATWSNDDSQGRPAEGVTPPLDIPKSENPGPGIEIPRTSNYNQPIDTKEELDSTVGQRAQSTAFEPVEKIEATSEVPAVEEGNQDPRFVKQEANSDVKSERLSSPRNNMEEEVYRPGGTAYNDMINELVGTRPLGGYEPIPLRAIPSLGDINGEVSMGLSDSLQRQYVIADQGIRELGRNTWDWGNRRQMGKIVDELASTPDKRKLTAERRRKELPRWRMVETPLVERLKYQTAAENGEEEAGSLSEEDLLGVVRKRIKGQRMSQQEIVDLLVSASGGREGIRNE
ncbi:hypothetical protein TWF718_002440 [Orbilia javanica]|uniref:Uncharacterized protein n=1 Tax=Orbilia javanica TaxID=47235 RepID=A0AAN8NM91_9PEZI